MSWIDPTKKAIKVILFNMAFIIFLLAFYELFIFFLVHHPSILKKCPMIIRNSIGHLYNSGIRHNIQFSPNCAQFDKNLGYILKPGHCIHSGIEFSNSYFINSVGVRDDELSLDHPQIIVSGDSFAMGWGVNQEETFAQLLEQKTGMRVLNASVSSYGTAREMIMLKRIPTDKLKYLIIQYCGNDYGENKSFFLDHNVLHTMSKEKYHYYVAEDQRKKYVFGKYVLMEIENRIKETFNSNGDDNKPIDKDEIDLFINAIMHSNLDLKNVQIIAFVMNGRIAGDNKEFPEALKKKIRRGDYPFYIRKMIVMDLSNILNDDNFYVLDDHMNKTGHAVVADVLYKIILEMNTF
ncbi:MAG: hypothetical protein APR62_09520 [Smithella sp. SDB]|nr:MAG: hypothetical protein APR62_09520 [Smithella sp. SDB]